jgi:hypothetical protein
MTIKTNRSLVAAVVFGWSFCAWAVDDVEGLKTFSITRTDTPPTIDGILDDAAWLQATEIRDLHQIEPRYRDAPTEETIVRITYDDDYLYVSADLRDSEPDKIVATQLIQGQTIWADDRFQIMLDSFNSKRNDYMFSVNANGVRREALRESNARFILDWVTIWQAASVKGEHGWTTEMAIPFKSISFDPNSDTWGVNFGRWIIRKREFNVWSSNDRHYWAGDAGEVNGIEGMQQGLGLDVVPTVNLIQQRDYLAGSENFEFEPSLDVLYKITPSLNAALTINTDFSAAEVDERQVALDRFSLFFPEKRDFFLQDAGIFEFANLVGNGRPFFSRRIGLSAIGQPIGIEVGGKLTGRTGIFNVGVLGVRQEAHVDFRGDKVTAKNLFVGRASINVLRESQLGMIATNGDPTSNNSNSLIGTDFIYRNSDGPFGETVLGYAWYQQSDTPGLDGEDEAFGALFQVPNDRLDVKLAALEIQENFKPALGFVNRAGIRQFDATARYRTRPEKGRWLRIDNTVQTLLVTDVNDDVLSRVVRIRPVEFVTRGNDSVSVEWRDNYERVLRPFVLFGRLPIPAGEYDFDRYRFEIKTGNQRPISAIFFVDDGGYFGGDRRETSIDIQWRQSAHFFLGIGFSQNDVKLPSGEFTSHLGKLRTDVAFNSRWSWSSFIQYDNVSEVLGVNTRLRYEPVAGREMLVVLNHGSLISPLNRFSSSSSEFVVKLAYTFRY